MKRILYSLSLLGLLLVLGCTKEGEVKPTNWNGNNNTNNPACSIQANLISGTTYQFSSTASGVQYYFWQFGDGNTSSLSSPTYKYTQSGKYTVKLTVTKTDGNTCQSAITLDVQQPIPTSVTIKRIIVTAFPQTNNGSAWDIGLLGNDRNPDIYPVLTLKGNQLYKATNYFEDAVQNNLPIPWNTNILIPESSFDSPMTIELWNHNVIDSDQFMGGFENFTMRKLVGQFPVVVYPKTVTLELSTSPYKFQLELEWN